MRGYYSLIQYCPNAFRDEGANIGVVVLCEKPRLLLWKMMRTIDVERIQPFFNLTPSDIESFKGTKSSIRRCLQVLEDNNFTLEEFKDFIKSRAGTIRFTLPRNMRITNHRKDVNRLYDELVVAQAPRIIKTKHARN